MIDGECLACQSDGASNLVVDRTGARVRSPRPVNVSVRRASRSIGMKDRAR